MRTTFVVLALVVVVAESALAACSRSAASPTGLPSASISPSATATPGTTGPGSPIFSSTGSMAYARSAPSALALQDGRVFVIGGEASPELGGPSAPSAELYDPKTGKFASAGKMQAARYYAAVAVLLDGRVLVTGGHDGQKMLRSAEIYDPATGKFDLTGPSLADRQDGAAVTLSDGRVLIVGGYANPWDGTYTKAEIYDPATGKFSATGRTAIERLEFSATLLRDGRVLIAGGTVPSRGDPAGYREATATAEIYDPATGKFSATDPLAVKRYGHTATLLPSGLILMVGGSTGDDSSLDSAELYDPTTGKFTATGSMVRPRSQHAASLLPDGRILMTGGYDFTRSTDGSGDVTELVLSSSELYDPATGLFVDGMTMTMARYGHAAVLLAGGSLLVLGGYGGNAAEVRGEEAIPQASAEVTAL